jgi:hypothetical protein
MDEACASPAEGVVDPVSVPYLKSGPTAQRCCKALRLDGAWPEGSTAFHFLLGARRFGIFGRV